MSRRKRRNPKSHTLRNIAIVAGGTGLAVFLLSKLSQAEAVDHELPEDLLTRGWHGSPDERPRVQLPKFAKTEAGRTAFVNTMVAALMRRGLSHESAILFTAHLARETGWGKAIWNNNIGNIKASRGTLRGPWFWMVDARGHRDKYRAYDTIEDGLDDDLALVRDVHRYQKSWSLLAAGDINWYGQLGLDGYYEGPKDPVHPERSTSHTPATIVPVQKEYNGIVAATRRRETPGNSLVGSVLASVESKGPNWPVILTAAGLTVVVGALVIGRD